MEQKFSNRVFTFLDHYILNNTKDGHKLLHVLKTQMQCTNFLRVLKTIQNKLSEGGCRQNRQHRRPIGSAKYCKYECLSL